MNKTKFRDDVSYLLKASRLHADVSQKELASIMGVSERTIQNWESGYSTPLVEQLFEWFEALKVQPEPYMLRLLHSDEFVKEHDQFTDSDVDKALIVLLSELSISSKRELLYLFYGNHGSSPTSVLDMITAHLHTQLRHRINVSEQIITNYEIADAMNEVIEGNHIRPNMERLKKATSNARNAILNQKQSYNTI